MKKLISAVSKISFASATNILSGIVRTKIFAIILGTFGIGIISQLTNFSNLVLFISSVGVPLGVTRYVSEWEKEGRWSEIYEIISKSISILILVSLLFLVLTIIFSKQISFLILDNDTYSIFLIITSIAFPFSLSISVFEACIKGLKKFDQLVKISVIISVVSLVLSVVFVIFFHIIGFTISFLLSQIIGLCIYIYAFEKNKIISLRNLKIFKLQISDSFKLILKLGAASLILGIVEQITLLSIRSMIIKYMGIDMNGIYQCVAGISNNYLSIFFMSLGAYIIPVLSEMKDVDRMNEEINNTVRLTLLVIVPIISFTFVLREYIILTLYSSKFLYSSDLMFFNFIGDYFKVLSWIFGSWLIPRSRIRLWLIFGVLYNINYFIIFAILTSFSLNIKNVVIAYAVAGVIHFIINLIFIRKQNKFRFRTDSLKLILFSTIFIFLVLFLSSYEVIISYFLIIPLLFLWLKISVTNEEIFLIWGLIKAKIRM